MSSLNKKITSKKTKHLLVENKLNKLKTFDLSYFIGKSHFEEDSTQNYLILQPVINYFKVNRVNNTNYVSSSKSNRLHAESIKPPSMSDNSLTSELNYCDDFKVRVTFTRSCLKQPKFSHTHKTIVTISIVYELGASTSNDNDPTLKICLFGAVTLTKNTNIDKYWYSCYGIGFDRRSSFSFTSGGFGQNVLIFGVGMSASVHINNKKKDILVLGRGPTQGLKHALTAEEMYSISITVTKKICLSLHCNGANSYLFVNGIEIYKFKAKILKLYQVHYI